MTSYVYDNDNILQTLRMLVLPQNCSSTASKQSTSVSHHLTSGTHSPLKGHRWVPVLQTINIKQVDKLREPKHLTFVAAYKVPTRNTAQYACTGKLEKVREQSLV